MQHRDGGRAHWHGARGHQSPAGSVFLVPPDPRVRALPARDVRWRFGRWPRLDPRYHYERPRPAFSLVELLAVIAIIAVLVALVVPMIHKTRRGEPANRVHCGSNLRQIGQALLIYANENKGVYPRVIYTSDKPPTWGTGAAAANPLTAPDRPADNDVTAAFWLLIRTQDITPEVFVCPVQSRQLDPRPDPVGEAGKLKRSNFTDWKTNLSYSYANPYPSTEAVVKYGYKLDQTNGAEFAIAADLNPGVGDGYDVTAPPDGTASQKVMQQANSRNHQGAGQNVLYGDGHVDFVQNPFVGVMRDNIYTVSGSTEPREKMTTSKTVVGSPTGAHDSVLLPAWK